MSLDGSTSRVAWLDMPRKPSSSSLQDTHQKPHPMTTAAPRTQTPCIPRSSAVHHLLHRLTLAPSNAPAVPPAGTPEDSLCKHALEAVLEHRVGEAVDLDTLPASQLHHLLHLKQTRL